MTTMERIFFSVMTGGRARRVLCALLVFLLAVPIGALPVFKRGYAIEYEAADELMELTLNTESSADLADTCDHADCAIDEPCLHAGDDNPAEGQENPWEDMSEELAKNKEPDVFIEKKSGGGSPLMARGFGIAGMVAKIQETGALFSTLTDAIDAANSLPSATIEISESFYDDGYAPVTSDITVIAVDGSHTVTTEYVLIVYSGGKLTLGDGSQTNVLTIENSGNVVRVFDGSFALNHGAQLIDSANSYATLELVRSSSRGVINGGLIQGNNAIELEQGAVISEISDGQIIGKQFVIHMSGNNTRIDKISGGSFIKTGSTVSTAFVVQNESSIGEISGGYFEAATYSPLGVYRGAWIEKITGGEFVSKKNDQFSEGGIQIVADVSGTYPKPTGVGEIKNVSISGGYYGIRVSGVNARIDTISSGVIEGAIALSNERDAVIGEIRGGELKGSIYGIKNKGQISAIGASALIISGPGDSGIYNSGTGAISLILGGDISGKTALSLDNGATIGEIRGGVFSGRQDVIHTTDVGTVISLISGGSYYQTDATVTLHGHVLFVQNYSRIENISGGYFEATLHNAMILIRGGTAGEISGGEFVVKRSGTNNTRNAAIRVENAESYVGTGIDTISGGTIRGTNFGILIIASLNTCHIGYITGGTITGVTAVQVDRGGYITGITGGVIDGTQGMLNVGVISEISGSAVIKGSSSYGIFNYQGGLIEEIAEGALISSVSSNGIWNDGTIKLISGGVIRGKKYAIYNDNTATGALNKITGGVFYSENNTAIFVGVSGLLLEPDLTGTKGAGRFWGKNGVIFNNDSLVVYPAGYVMSSRTEAVAGFSGAEFKYLTVPQKEVNVYVLNSYADTAAGEKSGAGEYLSGDTVTINAGTRDGYTFSGWITIDDVIFADDQSQITTFTIGDEDVSVAATWTEDIVPVYVSVVDSHVLIENGETSGEGWYLSGDTVTINGGARTGYTFEGWTTFDDVIFADADRQITTFTVGESNVTVYANWNENPVETNINVTVIGSFVNTEAGEESGEGVYLSGDIVTINAGTRDGYTFDGWTTFDGVTFDDPASKVTTFTVADDDVTVIANWTEDPVDVFVYVTVQGSHVNAEAGEESGEGEYLSGATVTINAGEFSGHTFVHWSNYDGVVFANEFRPTTTFVVGDTDVTVIAIWHANEEIPPFGPSGESGPDGSEDPGAETPANPDIPITPEDPVVPDPQDKPEDPAVSPPPRVPGGSDHSQPPTTNDPSNELIADGDRYIEVDFEGVPFGVWIWDDAKGWIFEEYPPYGSLPKTGDYSPPPLTLAVAVTLLSAGALPIFRKKDTD